ncbi:hypothetical protein JTB14_003092 [Gonioctena quinquepunctata]|nr:hypothetical protein JTB14_003092 [Gonioctena quinquepunctata]
MSTRLVATALSDDLVVVPAVEKPPARNRKKSKGKQLFDLMNAKSLLLFWIMVMMLSFTLSMAIIVLNVSIKKSGTCREKYDTADNSTDSNY